MSAKVVRCKFICDKIVGNADSKDITFIAVTDGSPENKEFWKYTPTGALQFSCVNPNVVFVEGKEYYLDISEAQNG